MTVAPASDRGKYSGRWYARVPIPSVLAREFSTYRDLDAGTRGSFDALYLVAHRPSPLGFLVDRNGRALSLRKLAYLTLIPRSTLTEHIDRLRPAGLIAEDTTGTLFVPPVQVFEEFLSIAPASPGPASTRDVENLALFDPSDGSGGRSSAESGRDPAPPYTPQVDDENIDRPGVFDVDVENPTGADWIDLVPTEIEQDQLRFNLAQLAREQPHFRHVLRHHGERASLVDVYRRWPVGLAAAAESARLARVEIRKPGAWLRRTAESRQEGAA